MYPRRRSSSPKLINHTHQYPVVNNMHVTHHPPVHNHGQPVYHYPMHQVPPGVHQPIHGTVPGAHYPIHGVPPVVHYPVRRRSSSPHRIGVPAHGVLVPGNHQHFPRIGHHGH